MLLRELIFQGVQGAKGPVRLRMDEELSSVALPPGIAVDDVQDMILSLLYPARLNAAQRAKVSGPQDLKIAGVLETSKGPLRIFRGPDLKSVAVQRERNGRYEDLARGPSEVQAFLQKHFRLPELEVCLALNMWRFEVGTPEASVEATVMADDPRVPELIEMYKNSLKVEKIEDRLKEVEAQVVDGQKALGDSAEIEEKLGRAREKLDAIALPELSKEELALLRSKEARLDDFDQQIRRLSHEEDSDRRQIELCLPNKPYRQPLFWIGLVLTLVATTMSILNHETMRSYALANIVSVGLVAWVLLQYFNNMGRATVYQVRLESIKRRLNQVREDQVLFLEEIDHVLFHSGVSNEAELFDRLPMVEKLQEVVRRLEEQLETMRSDTRYVKARTELDSLVAERSQLRTERQSLPSFVMNSFQLENDLKSMGVDPVAVLNAATSTEPVSGEEEESTPFKRLRRIAEKVGLWEQGELDASAHKMWGKMCAHLLNERFSSVSLSADGQLLVGALNQEQLDLWFSTRASEVRVVQAALALALRVNLSSDDLQSVWIGDPGQSFTAGHATKFESVFRSAAKKNHIVTLKA
jgi:hypothetical protein